jgi:DUF4097 and DUF4098 domain-containing protein YvlB
MATLLLMTSLLAGCGIELTEHSTTGLATIDPLGELVVINGNGRIAINTHSQPGLRVVVEKKARAVTRERAAELLEQTDVLLSQKVGQATVQFDAPQLGMSEMVATELTLYVPRDFAGKITVTNGNGDVRCTNLEGSANLSTDNGSVVVSDWEGALTAQTDNGSINVSQARLNSNSNFTVGNGNINLELDSLNANLVATTFNGKIIVDMPTGAGVDLDANVANGLITVLEHGVKTHESHGRLSIPLNNGGQDMILQTMNGSITVEEQ